MAHDARFPTLRMRELVVPIGRAITPDEGAMYPLLGVRLYGRGVRLQGEFAGADLQAPSLYAVQEGDLIYNKMWASKGTFALVPALERPHYVTNEYPVFRARPGVAPAFLEWIMRRPQFWARAEAWSRGTTDRARLNPSDFLRMPVEIPAEAEQCAVARVLGSAQKAVALQEALGGDLLEAKRNVMRELLTLGVTRDPGQLRPLNERWVMGRIADGVTTAPAGWRLVQLTKVAKLESGHTPSRERPDWWDGNIPWISLQDTERLNALEIFDSAETIGEEGLANSSARLLPKGTVVFQRTASVGQCSIMGRPMATSQHFANWVCGPDLDPRYLLQVFRHMGREWERLQAGSVLPDIYMQTFKRLQILLPSRAEQKRIADVGEAFDRRLAAEQARLVELRATRDALAAELLSGRLRLPAAVIARYASTGSGVRAA
jgi:type I restriction enzyme, S subunit